MFQNIANDFSSGKSQVKDVKLNTDEISSVLKKIFSIKNIVIYIISFLISMISFGGDASIGLAPFGLAILAATASSGIPISIVYISTLLGTFVGFGTDVTGSYFLTSLVFFATLFIIKAKKQSDVNEKIKLGKNIVISIAIARVLPMIFTSVNISNLIISVMLCILTYIFYKIFSNALNVIYEYGEKSVFSVEELMGAGLTLAIAISALSPIHILGYSVKNILCILIVLILGWKSGILVGTTGGVTIGIVLGIIGNEDPITVAAFAIAGLLAGVFRKIGRIGVIVGFVIGNIVITYFSNGNIEPVIVFQEILIASVALLAIPKKAEVLMDEIFNDSTLLTETTTRTLSENKDTVSKLTNMSETISEIAKSYDEVVSDDENQNSKEQVEEKFKIFEKELNENLENLDDNLLCEDIKNSKDITKDIYDCLTKEITLTKDILVSIFAKHNNYIVGLDSESTNKSLENDIKTIIEVINKSYEKSKINLVWQKKLDEKNKNMSTQLKGVSEAISDLAEDIKIDNENRYNAERDMIRKLLFQRGIVATDISITQNESERKIVNVYVEEHETQRLEDVDLKKMQKIISKVLQEKMVMQKKKAKNEVESENNVYSFISGDIYNLKVGIAKSKKFESPVSGDSSLQTKLNDGKYLLAISDGMGSGPEARKSSKIAVKMLERMLKSGFKKDVSIKLINSTLSANTNEDMYATLDVMIMDLYKGNLEFIKNGACPTYVKRHKEVELINSVALPAGIVENVDLVVYDKDIQSGDIIVMCSDGILESNGEYLHKELWIKYFLEELQTDDVQQIADLLISQAIDNDYGKEKDDMTVIVAKVEK